MLLNYPTVETVGCVEEDNLVKNHSQRFQPLEIEAKFFLKVKFVVHPTQNPAEPKNKILLK